MSVGVFSGVWFHSARSTSNGISLSLYMRACEMNRPTPADRVTNQVVSDMGCWVRDVHLPFFFFWRVGGVGQLRTLLEEKTFLIFSAFFFSCFFFLHERRNKRNTHVFNWERATTKVTNDWILRQEHRPWSLVFLHPRSRCGTKSRPHCNHLLVFFFLPHPHTVLSRLATRARKRWKRNQWEDAIVSTRHFYTYMWRTCNFSRVLLLLFEVWNEFIPSKDGTKDALLNFLAVHLQKLVSDWLCDGSNPIAFDQNWRILSDFVKIVPLRPWVGKVKPAPSFLYHFF